MIIFGIIFVVKEKLFVFLLDKSYLFNIYKVIFNLIVWFLIKSK